MSQIETFLSDDVATRQAGAKLAALLRAGDIVALYGGLGAGKTTLSRGLISTLMGEETEVPSPTYTLVQIYDGPTFQIFHYDLYRLKSANELTELGWDETQDGLALVEWPEQAGDQLPAWRLDVHLTAYEGGRKLRLEAHGEDWQTRIYDFTF
jgi:tRNA threonylcarbamoyladenosine biosynthesis protein TsaE